jgi:SAM-dependent methyltransferase
VDVGCGTGGFSAAFVDGYRYTGLDPQPEAIAIAKRKFPHADFRRGFVPHDTKDLTAQADIILLIGVIQMVDDDFTMISEILGTMKSGAFLLIMTSADPRLWNRHDRAFAHRRRYTEQRLRQTWVGLPVQEVIYSHLNARLYPIVRIGKWLGRYLEKTWGPSDTDLALPPYPLNAILRWIFAGERHRLLQGGRYRRGVSLMALLRRQEGNILTRTRPAHIPPESTPWYDSSHTLVGSRCAPPS